jgi:PucR family transcriptional regulator, purine catabolism regulatory protein
MDKSVPRLRDLASASLLDRSRLLAGRAGLDRPVARVVVRDVGPGTRLQAREGDLVVARRAGMPGGGEGRQLVTRLAELGAAGLVFVDGHYLTGALAGVRATADETGLPLFALPRGIDARAAGASLEAALTGGGTAAAAAAIDAAARLTRAAGDGGVPGVVEALAVVTGLGVVLQDPTGRRLHVAGRTEGPAVAVHPVTGGDLALHGSGAGVLAEPLLAQAAALIVLESGRGDPVSASRDRREAERVRRFLATPATDEPVVVLVVAAGEPALAGRLREMGAVCGHAADDLVALLPAAVDLDRVAAVLTGTAWGAGSASNDGARGLAEARAARKLGPVLGRAPVYAEVRVADALLEALGHDGAAALADEIVGNLSPELLATLAAVLESGLSVAAAADRLYVHKNTVRYRLRRIEKLTGRRIANLADRLELEGAAVANMLKDPLDGG